MEKTWVEKSKSWKFDHVGVVVKDLEKAIDYYQSLGIGPFILYTPGPVDRKIYGKPANIKLKGAAAPMGPISLELIQPVEGESLQKEFLESKGEGVNHIGFMVDDIDKEVEKLEKEGFKLIVSGENPRRVFAYFDTTKIGGIIIQLAQEKIT